MDTPTSRLALECYPIYFFYYLWSKQHPNTWQYIGIRLVITYKACIMMLMIDNVVVKHLDTWQYIGIRLVITYKVCIMMLMTDNVVVKHLDIWQYIGIRLVITYYV